MHRVWQGGWNQRVSQRAQIWDDVCKYHVSSTVCDEGAVRGPGGCLSTGEYYTGESPVYKLQGQQCQSFRSRHAQAISIRSMPFAQVPESKKNIRGHSCASCVVISKGPLWQLGVTPMMVTGGRSPMHATPQSGVLAHRSMLR